MRIRPVKRFRIPKKSPFRRGDGVRLAYAMATLTGMLLLLFATARHFNVFTATAAAAATAAGPDHAAAQAQPDAQEEERERRVGSIVFVATGRLCEEQLFDNLTGRVLSEEQVDCESRLLRTNAGEAAAAKTARMRGVLNSFKK